MKKLLQSLSFSLFIKLTSFLKFSYVIGSHMVWFSSASALAPLSGAFGGIRGSNIVFLGRFFLHLLLYKTASLSFLAFCIPGYCASLYWASNSSLIRVFLPLLCMGLFISHPIGGQAFAYSLYWLIPVGLFAISRKIVLLEALGSTFVAHAVGSVIWLYTMPTNAQMWIGLIPLVALERLLFAISMVVMYYVIVGCSNVKTSRLYYGWKSAMGYASKSYLFKRAS